MSGSSTASPPGTTSPIRRRARVAARTRLDFWLDAVILVGYTVAYSYGFTGVVVHEWLGIALGIALLLHLTLHWAWVVRTSRRLFRPRGHDKLIWLVNLALLFAMTLVQISLELLQTYARTRVAGATVRDGPGWGMCAPGPVMRGMCATSPK